MHKKINNTFIDLHNYRHLLSDIRKFEKLS